MSWVDVEGSTVPLLVLTGPDQVGSVGVPEWSPVSTWQFKLPFISWQGRSESKTKVSAFFRTCLCFSAGLVATNSVLFLGHVQVLNIMSLVE
jgi:hypothetical protein